MGNRETGGNVDDVFNKLNSDRKIREILNNEKIRSLAQEGLDIINRLDCRSRKTSSELFHDLSPLEIARIIHEFITKELEGCIVSGDDKKISEFKEILNGVRGWLDKTKYVDDLPDNEDDF